MKCDVFTALRKAPVVGILKGYTSEEALCAAEAFFGAGLSVLEISISSPDAFGSLSSLRLNFPESVIGVGTVKSETELYKAVERGADFALSPIASEKLIVKARELKIPYFPGASTPTEIFHAHAMGAEMVKFFPHGGLNVLTEIHNALPEIPLLPTGGIDASNIVDFLKAGARAVGVGTALFPKEALRRCDCRAVSKAIALVVNALAKD